MSVPLVSRRQLLALAGAAGGLVAAGGGRAAAAGTRAPSPARRAIADEVRREFLHAWNAYKRLAWGQDELLPVSGTFRDFFADGHPVGLTIIESLDTLFFMELDDDLDRSVRWIKDNVDFDIDADFQMFETVIRVLGGLLSGFHCTGDRALLELARDVGDRMLPCFTESPTGAPYRFVNPHTGEVSGPRNFLAEIGTNIAEFGDLSALTRDPKYFRASKRAYQAVVDRRSDLGLVGTTLNVETGEWVDGVSSINPPVDSFYEYLWDGWFLFRDRDLLRWYREFHDAIVRHQAERFGGHLWFKRVDHTTGELFDRHQSELGSFYAGLLGEGGDLRRGAAYHDSWAALTERWEILPEDIDYSTLEVLGAGNQLRPEFVDSAFALWLHTGSEVYRDRALRYFRAVKRNARVPNGYTIIDDVTTRPMKLGDLTSAYWYSENMKYYYLMFADSPRFNYRDNYLTTEGDVLRGVIR